MNTPRWVLLAALGLGGCAGFSRDGGFDPVAQATRLRLAQDIEWPRTEAEQAKVALRVSALLDQPLSADEAVQIALLNNRTLRGWFEELGISEADLVRSGRPPNPRLDLRRAGAAGVVDVEQTVSFNLVSLLAMPYAHGIEKRRFAEVQSAVMLQVLALAQDTREAFYTALAAHQSLEYLLKVNSAAQTSAALARRMVAAGNWTDLDEAREQFFSADAQAALTRAQSDAAAALERLTALLGLDGDAGDTAGNATGAGNAAGAGTAAVPGTAAPLRLAERLPDLPSAVLELPGVDAAALQSRVDLQLMRSHLDALAESLKLTRSTRFLDALDVGPTRVKQGSGRQPYETGYALSFEVPLFDGDVRVRKSAALYAQAADDFAQAAIEARAQIRVAYGNYRAAFDLAAQQRDVVLPLRKSVAELDLKRYNASLISIFELLDDAREGALGVDEYIRRLRDFWIAKSRLDAALLGVSPNPSR